MNLQQNIPAFTVTDVNRYIKTLFSADEVLSSVVIRGEISNFKVHSSGHLYFTLKDEGAEISAVMFRGDASRMGFRPTDGMRVLVYGTVDIYEKTARIQVYVRTMLADGAGAMAQAYERLKKQLESEGLFDESRKRPLPEFPTCVGVITAPTGAAIRDILNITGRRYPNAKILIYPSLVQGQDAPSNLCAGLAYLNATEACDVIILGRGGGSIEDLWAFNDERLVRSVAASKIPVISAVGHETDFTLCDFAADRRAPTPSAAAELAVPDREALLRQVENRSEQLTDGILQRLNEKKNGLEARRQTLTLLSPQGKLKRIEQQLTYQRQLLLGSVTKVRERDQARVRGVLDQLNALNPLAVLQRGYSALQNDEGTMLGSVRQLKAGQAVRILLRDGSAEAEIRHVKKAKGEKA